MIKIFVHRNIDFSTEVKTTGSVCKNSRYVVIAVLDHIRCKLFQYTYLQCYFCKHGIVWLPVENKVWILMIVLECILVTCLSNVVSAMSATWVVLLGRGSLIDLNSLQSQDGFFFLPPSPLQICDFMQTSNCTCDLQNFLQVVKLKGFEN